MRKFTTIISVYAFAALMVFGFAATASAQNPSQREVRDALRNLNSKLGDFRYNIDNRMRSNSADRRDRDFVDANVTTLQTAIGDFETNFNERRENRSDVEYIVTSARGLDEFVRSTNQNRRIRDDWDSVRSGIERLSALYGIVPDWSATGVSYSSTGGDTGYTTPAYSHPLTGTYALDPSQSEDAAQIIADLGVRGANRADLESKLRAKPEIAIYVDGNRVTLATSDTEPVTFDADGSERIEMEGSRQIRVRATLRGDELVLSSVGGETDHNIKFVAIDGGRTLKVTRRFTTPYLAETVFADSVYTRTDTVAGLGINAGPNDTTYAGEYSSNDPNDVYSTNTNTGSPTITQGRTGEYLVPNGVAITGILETAIDTKVSQNNDRFRLTVQSPGEFRGAVVSGHISKVERSGQVSGRPNVTFNFEKITLRDGRIYDFAGTLVAVKDHNGKELKVDEEGTAEGDSQTKESVKRGGIGAGLGALIGAIAGGGKGAIIGAIIGGAGGAGSVAIMGRDDIRLMKGSEITVRSSSPIRPSNGN